MSLPSVAKVPKKDLAVQINMRVNLINYWVDVWTGRVLCLSQAPDSAANAQHHKEAHGMCPVIEKGKTGKLIPVFLVYLRLSYYLAARTYPPDRKTNRVSSYMDEVFGIIIDLDLERAPLPVFVRYSPAHFSRSPP